MVVLTGGERAGEGPEHLHSPNVPAWLCGCPGAQPELVPIRGTPPHSREKPHFQVTEKLVLCVSCVKQSRGLSLEKRCKSGSGAASWREMVGKEEGVRSPWRLVRAEMEQGWGREQSGLQRASSS